MIANKNTFITGLVMMIGFIIVLIIFFSPIFNGKNGLDYLDNLYNSISKGSAYYIPKVKNETAPYKGTSISVTMNMETAEKAEQVAKLFRASGCKTEVTGPQLKAEGDLGTILDNCLIDADAMYYNQGGQVSDKYGYNERLALYNWWKAFKEMDKDLKRQKKFKEAEIVALAVKKAVETSYNYYKIEPQEITERFGIVILSLVFYVIYTLWYGFAFMFLFEGWGLRLEH